VVFIHEHHFHRKDAKFAKNLFTKKFKNQLNKSFLRKRRSSNSLILDELDPRFRGNDGLNHP
jgi:hypothetical protein